eukprot:SAG11_NODE_14003_length_629_cov_0.858491_1_plen_123_part_00
MTIESMISSVLEYHVVNRLCCTESDRTAMLMSMNVPVHLSLNTIVYLNPRTDLPSHKYLTNSIAQVQNPRAAKFVPTDLDGREKHILSRLVLVAQGSPLTRRRTGGRRMVDPYKAIYPMGVP